jgi:hypothetical protein
MRGKRLGKVELAARLVPVVLLAGMAGCHWVPLTEGGEGVRVVSQAEASACEKIGMATSKTADHVLIFARTQRKVHEELESLARNEAATMGGNAVAPTGEPAEGRQSFDVYRCRQP